MSGVLFAVYVTVVWLSPGGVARWYEIAVTQRNIESELFRSPRDRYRVVEFSTREVCERYRPQLVAAWIANPEVPFHLSNLAASRCGPWEPDPEAGDGV